MTMTPAQAAARIQAGDLVAFPTETVYGLGADASNDAAVAKIFAAKGRPADHPLIVHVKDAQAAQHFAAQIPDFAQRLIGAFWPGPLTVIVPRKQGVAAASAGGQDSIGLRCPAHPLARELLAECAHLGLHGVAAPSANKFGKVSPTTAAHVRAEFGDEATSGIPVLDGGACEVGIESTIIDCTRGAPVLLRPGTLTRAQLESALQQSSLLNSEQTNEEIYRPLAQNAFKTPVQTLPGLESQEAPGVSNKEAPRGLNREAPRASGMLESHYAPHAKLRLMDAKALQTALDLLGQDAKHIAIYARAPLKTASSQVILRRMPDDALATAQQLFAVLREFDAQGVKLIWVETVPQDTAWDGVRDRLQRAAA
jgi:L-threonylcarbamoyladenylate synthase